MDKNTEDTDKRLDDINTATIWSGDAKEWMDVAERLDLESGRGQDDTLTNHHKLNISLMCTGMAFELAYKSLLVAELKRPKKTQRIEKLHKMLKAETQRTIEDWIKEAGWNEGDDLLKYLDEHMVPPDRKYSIEYAREQEKQSRDFTPTEIQAIPKLAPVLYKLADLGEQNLAKARDISEPNQSPPQDDLDRILEIIREIVEKSASGEHIYRGEAEHHDKVSSTLYREYEEDIEAENFDIEIAQKEMLKDAKKHTGDLSQDFRTDPTPSPNVGEEDADDPINFKLLTGIQHYGGDTNLIDFTTDYFIALFFACDGHHDEDGRVILQRTEEIKNIIEPPRDPRHRVIAQKSVFVRAPKGFIEPPEADIVPIPANLKQPLLQHLRKYHGISTETIYNDLHGFIRVQHLHKSAYTEFYKGLTCQNREQYNQAIEHYTETLKLNPLMVEVYYDRGNVYYSKGDANGNDSDYDNAIEDFTRAIQFKPDFAGAYTNRGNAYVKKRNYDRGIEDHNKAIELKPDYANAYFNRGGAYKSKGDDCQNQGDYDLSIADFTQAIEINPNFVGAYNHRGVAYRAKGDYDRAITDFNKAIEFKPDAEVYNNLGITYRKQGKIDRAIVDHNKAIECDSNFGSAYYNRGLARLLLREWERAKSDLMTAKAKGANIVTEFYKEYTSVPDFESKHGIQLPADIAAMLTPPA